jgi:tape measure domain-containing protein
MANRLNVALLLDSTVFRRQMRLVLNDLEGFGRRLEEVGQGLTGRLSVPLGLAGGAAVQAFLQFDKLEKGLQVFSSSAEEAEKQMQALNQVVLDSRTTIGFQDAVQGSLRLQSIGFSADQAREALRQLAIATTASGKSSEDLGEVTNQLSQIIGRGQVLQQDIRIILDRLPILSKVFQETFGGVNAEAIRNSTENVGDFAAKLFTAIQQSEELQKVQGSAAKSVETFKESTQLAAAALGETIFESLRLDEVLNLLSGAIDSLIAGFKSLSPETQRLISTFGVLLVTIGPLLIGIGALAKTLPLLVSGFAAVGAPGLAVVAVFGGILFAVQKLADEFDSLPDAFAFVSAKLAKLGAYWKEVFSGIGREASILFRSIKARFTDGEEGYAEILREQGLSLQKAQQEGNAAFEKSLRNYAAEQQAALLDQRKIIQDSQQFDFSSLVESFKNQLQGDPLLDALGGGKRGNEAEKEANKFAVATSNVNAAVAGLAQTAKGPFGFIRSQLSDVFVLTPEVNKQKDALAAYAEQVRKISVEANILGEDPLPSVLEATKSALSAAIQQGEGMIDVIRILSDEYDKLTNSIRESDEATKRKAESDALVAQYQQIVSAGFETGAQIIEEYGLTLQNVFKAIGKAALKGASDFLRAKIIEGVASVVADSLKKFGLAGLVIAAGAGAAAGALFQGVISKIQAPKLAKGGFVTSQTLAVIGDNPSGKEAVIPFERMGEFLNMFQGQGGYVAETRISGEDLLILVNRAERRNNRVR